MPKPQNSDNQDWSQGVSIIVPTYKRPDALLIALKSLENQSAGTRPIELIIADNDPAGSAKTCAEAFARHSRLDARYIHVPEPGVSNARNGAMAAARGRYRAFLDDDMEATKTWLSALMDVTEACEASVCFGPIDAKMPDETDPLGQFMHPYFSRECDAPSGLIEGPFGMGGCLIDLERCDMPVPPFNTDMNEVGGEDDWLFAYLIERDAKMAWAAEALTYEHVPESRLNLSYFWDRNFASGQGPTQSAADKGIRGTFGVIKWMIVGALQTAVFAPVYGFLKLTRHPRAIVYYAKLAQGIGKILWWDGFSPRMYGTASTVGNKAT